MWRMPLMSVRVEMMKTKFDTIPPLVMLILTVNIYSENYDRIIVNIYA